MRTIDQWLDAYGESHRHPVNKLIHRIAVPIIVLDILGLLYALPTERLGMGAPNAAWLAVLLSLGFYARLSLPLAAGMTALALPTLALIAAVASALGAWFVPALAIVFVVAWIAQFVGHSIEGKKPSFTDDIQFLLIGPLWLLADAYRRTGLAYARLPSA